MNPISRPGLALCIVGLISVLPSFAFGGSCRCSGTFGRDTVYFSEACSSGTSSTSFDAADSSRCRRANWPASFRNTTASHWHATPWLLNPFSGYCWPLYSGATAAAPWSTVGSGYREDTYGRMHISCSFSESSAQAPRSGRDSEDALVSAGGANGEGAPHAPRTNGLGGRTHDDTTL